MDSVSTKNIRPKVHLKDIFWTALFESKRIIPFMLLCGILLMSAFFVYQNRLELAGRTDNLNADSLKASMEDKECAQVEFYVSLTESLERNKAYLKNSYLMNADPYHLSVLQITYLITADNERFIGAAKQLYASGIESFSFIQSLSSAFPADLRQEYVAELLNVASDDGDNTLTVTVILPAETDTMEIIRALDAQVALLQSQISATVGTHSINRFSSEESIRANLDYVLQKSDIESAVLSAEKQLAEAQGDFSAKQESLYRLLLADNQNTSPQVITEHKPSVLWFIVGCILGIVIYLIIILFSLFRRSVLVLADELEETVGLYNLGEIREFHVEGFAQISKTSKNAYYSRYKSVLNTARQTRFISENIVRHLKNAGLFEASLITFEPLDETHETHIYEITKEVEREDVLLQNPYLMQVSEGGALHPTISKYVILVLIGGATRYKDIEAFLSICEKENIDVLGSIFLDC